MASVRVFLVCTLLALAYSSNWLDNSGLVAEEREIEDQNSVTWLDVRELELKGEVEDDVEDELDYFESEVDSLADLGIFSGAGSSERKKDWKNKKDRKDTEDRKDKKDNKDIKKDLVDLTCENFFGDKFCKKAKPMCKTQDKEDKTSRKLSTRVRTYCRKSCKQCKKSEKNRKKSLSVYIKRIQRAEKKLSTCEDRISSKVCQKFKSECTKGELPRQVFLQYKCRETCGFCTK